MSRPGWFDDLPDYRPPPVVRDGVRTLALGSVPDGRDRVVLDQYDVWEIREFHLDAATSAYRLHAVHRTVLDLEQPVRLTLPIAELVTA